MWVHRFSRFLNDVAYEFNREGSAGQNRYEPVALHVFVPVNSARVPRLWEGQQLFIKRLAPDDWHLTDENFAFALNQLPALERIDFSGWGDPLLDPELPRIIQDARSHCDARFSINSHGLFSPALAGPLLRDPPERLTINLVAHKPSAYAAWTHQPASQHLQVVETSRQLLETRKRYYPCAPVFIEASMVVDRMNLEQIPDMVRLAEQVGFDGIRLQNATGDPLLALKDNQAKVRSYLDALRDEDFGIQVILPALLPDDPPARNCTDPHETVSLLPDLRVSPCSLQRLGQPATELNVWDKGLWQSHRYQELRQAHQKDSSVPLPDACRLCSRNTHAPARVLNPRPLPSREKKRRAVPKSAMW